jgi:hypothetical protein
MGVRRAQDQRAKLAREIDVVAVTAVSRDETQVLLAQYGLADTGSS